MTVQLVAFYCSVLAGYYIVKAVAPKVGGAPPRGDAEKLQGRHRAWVE